AIAPEASFGTQIVTRAARRELEALARRDVAADRGGGVQVVPWIERAPGIAERQRGVGLQSQEGGAAPGSPEGVRSGRGRGAPREGVETKLDVGARSRRGEPGLRDDL